MNDLDLKEEKDFDWSFLKTKKVVLLLPWVAPCYVAIKVIKYLWMFFMDFWHTIGLKKTEERQKYIEQFEEEKAMRESEFDMISIAFIVSGIYYLIGNEYINVPSKVFLIYIAAIINVLGVVKILSFLSLFFVLYYGVKSLKGGKTNEK